METYQLGPAGDAHHAAEPGGQQDEEEQGEEEGRAADELKEVERATAQTAAHHLLHHEGQERQQLGAQRSGRLGDAFVQIHVPPFTHRRQRQPCGVTASFVGSSSG